MVETATETLIRNSHCSLPSGARVYCQGRASPSVPRSQLKEPMSKEEVSILLSVTRLFVTLTSSRILSHILQLSHAVNYPSPRESGWEQRLASPLPG